jgi:RNA polymerase sigma factor (sigma-70 family)
LIEVSDTARGPAKDATDRSLARPGAEQQTRSALVRVSAHDSTDRIGDCRSTGPRAAPADAGARVHCGADAIGIVGTRSRDEARACAVKDHVGGDRRSVADALLERSYDSYGRHLAMIGRWRYGLSVEDCEEAVSDTLLAWHRRLCTPQGVDSDRAFCEAVLRARAIDHLRRRRWTVAVDPLKIDKLSIDPQLDVLVGERERIAELREVAHQALGAREYAVLLLVEAGVSRDELADQLGVPLRQLKRLLARAREKLDAANRLLGEHGRCERC